MIAADVLVEALRRGLPGDRLVVDPEAVGRGQRGRRMRDPRPVADEPDPRATGTCTRCWSPRRALDPAEIFNPGKG